MSELFASIGHFFIFSCRALVNAFLAILHPVELARQFTKQFLGAFPLAIVVGSVLGIVVWMHLRGVLVRLGGPSAAALLPSGLTLAVVLELGPIGAGLVVAGRTGAALSAELGAMRLTEQVNAMEMLGQSIFRRLVGPRVLACMLVLPLLTIFIDYLAVLGSFAAETLTSHMSWLSFSTACLRELRMHDVVPHTLKTVAFGFIIGSAGCYHGLQAAGGSESVGVAATRGVVAATLGVLFADVLLVRLIQLIFS